MSLIHKKSKHYLSRFLEKFVYCPIDELIKMSTKGIDLNYKDESQEILQD